MITLLKGILCVLQNLVLGVLWALVELVNLLIAGVGALVNAAKLLLPDMPGALDLPAGAARVLGYINWVLPVSGLLGGLVVVLTLWAAFLVARVALRWAKVVGS